MYTAKIINKAEIDGILTLTVEFSNGVKTYTEKVKPQDKVGFEHWVKARITSLNALNELTAEDNVGKEVVFSKEEVPVCSVEETERNAWLDKYRKWVRIKQTVVDTGIVPATNTKIVAMLDDLKAKLKPEYIDFI